MTNNSEVVVENGVEVDGKVKKFKSIGQIGVLCVDEFNRHLKIMKNKTKELR